MHAEPYARVCVLVCVLVDVLYRLSDASSKSYIQFFDFSFDFDFSRPTTIRSIRKFSSTKSYCNSAHEIHRSPQFGLNRDSNTNKRQEPTKKKKKTTAIHVGERQIQEMFVCFFDSLAHLLFQYINCRLMRCVALNALLLFAFNSIPRSGHRYTLSLSPLAVGLNTLDLLNIYVYIFSCSVSTMLFV